MTNSVQTPPNNQSFSKLAERPVKAGDLLKDLTPPLHFREARFDNYFPDPAYLSQQDAVERIEQFLSKISLSNNPRASHTSVTAKLASILRTLSGDSRNAIGSGLYLDGGFGIGKTHLLAAAYHRFDADIGAANLKAYLTFQELMFLVGLQGLAQTVQTLRGRKLIVIDEFELDDPANTRICTNLLSQLFSAGVFIIASSNTPPGALGEGKFSVESFQRELGELFSRFEILRIEGDDYRITHGKHRDTSGRWLAIGEALPAVDSNASKSHDKILFLEFSELLHELSLAHPIRIRIALQKFDALRITGIRPIADPHSALRFVYFIDKVYDDNLDFAATSAIPINQLFDHSIFQSGDTKKYLRTISRLEEMTSTSKK